MTALIGVPISTPDFELRTPDFRPDTWHPIPHTCFPPPFVFIDISGCTFIFEVQETGVRRQNAPH